MKRFIFAAKSRSDLGAWIEDHTPQVMIAIAQLYVFPSGNRTHWRKEVWEKFSEMHAFKHNNKLPSAKFILDNSWKVNERYVDNVIRFVIGKEEEYTPREDINVSELYDILESYFKWLADYLSKNRFLIPQDVNKKLDELGLTK